MSQTLTEEWRKRAALLASPLGHSNGNVTGGGGICLYLSTQWQKEENSGSLRPVCLHSTYTGQTKLHKETLSHENCKRTANLQVRIYYYCLYSSVRGEPILPLSFMVFDCKSEARGFWQNTCLFSPLTCILKIWWVWITQFSINPTFPNWERG